MRNDARTSVARRSMHLGLVVIGVGLVTVAGCKPRSEPAAGADASTPAAATPASSTSSASGAPILTVTATDFAFDAPAQVPSGLTSIVLVNKGQSLHHVQLFRLTDGKTMADLAAGLKNPAVMPPWMVASGGPNAANPGATTQATVQLVPGNYVMLCVIPGPDHAPHVAKGMVRPLTVSDVQQAASLAAPQAAATITMTDYAFTLSSPLAAGAQTIRVDNQGKLDHETVVIRLAPGKTAMDLAKWVDNQTGPPPAEGAGGITAVAAGAQGYFTVNLTPGNYALLCFVPDSKDGKPHIAHGMVKEFTI